MSHCCCVNLLPWVRLLCRRYGIKGLIIDPYNELDTRRGQRVFETEYVSCMLSKIKRFAQQHECHVWFVAHPRTQRGFGIGGGSAGLPAPSMYDISGSAHFINKADNGIVIHRPYTGTMAEAEGRPTHMTQVLIRKVRNKVAGSIGDVTLEYDRATGRYKDIEQI
jgi:twinkle protein